MKMQELVKKIATEKNVKQVEAENWIQIVLDSIFEAVQADGSFRTSYGTFTLKTCAAREARVGRNPHTGEPLNIPATPEKKKVSFSMSKSFKEKLNA